MRASSVEQIIIETLSKEHAHLTSQQVFEIIRKRLPAVNQSTVYRALTRLVDSGKVSVSDMGTKAVVYELLTDGLHHHLVCQKCRQIMTIGHEEVEDFFGDLQLKNHFQIVTNHLILFGICENCQVGTNTNTEEM
ncbi:MAG: transcriptional repressor [Anaerolineaceae bacterium]|nr:transcriptional repressor [Anaerolineaceae bacterium]MDD4043548.1 transcriptional repressor [Anaerolineaceae bacterium]MDD4577933.1 transcriptional repressor [Anaerolineaceae bacterium]